MFADRVAQLLAAGDVDAACELVESVEQSQPADHEIGRAALAVRAGDAAAAAEHAHRALALGAGAMAHVYLAIAKVSTGDASAAVDHARKAVALDASFRYRATLGSMLLAAGRADDAAAVLKQALTEAGAEANVDHRFDSLMALAAASIQLGDYGEAMQSYARAFDLKPTDQRPVESLMQMFADLGKWLGAVAALELSRKGEPPPEVSVALDLVMVHLVRLIATKFPQPGVGADADDAVSNLIANAKRRGPRTQIAVARTLLDLERVDDARQLVEHLARQQLSSTDRASLLYLQGVMAERGHQVAAALDSYSQAFATDPDRTDACVNAISLWLADGSAAAFDAIGKLLAKIPPAQRQRAPELMFNEGIYLVRSNRRDDARAIFERLVRVTGGDGKMGMLARKALDELV